MLINLVETNFIEWCKIDATASYEMSQIYQAN